MLLTRPKWVNLETGLGGRSPRLILADNSIGVMQRIKLFEEYITAWILNTQE